MDKEDGKAAEEFKSNKTRDEEMEASMKRLMEIRSEINVNSKEMDIDEEENRIKQEMKDRSNMLKAQKKVDDTIEFNFSEFDSQWFSFFIFFLIKLYRFSANLPL